MYLATLGLSCSMRNLSLRCTDSSCGAWAHQLWCTTNALFPDQGSNLCSLQLQGGFLTTGPPAKSWDQFLNISIFHNTWNSTKDLEEAPLPIS